jgi:hypothetical protein
MTTVRYRFRRTDHAGPTVALLLLSERAADLLSLVAHLGAAEWPTVYAVPGGFLVKGVSPPGPVAAPTMRLRALADNLFLPVDANLEPALLADEAAGLVRERGLVFIPGGGVLGFAAAEPLPASAFLTAPCAPEGEWQPLPARPERAEHLREVLLDQPDGASELIVERGGAGIGGEDPLAGPAGAVGSAIGHASMALGKGLLRLANLLRWRGLANFAAALVGSALTRVPRLSESLLGRQEAVLRALLREFREGDLERALRRALPMGSEALRGSTAATSANLPLHDTRFSLSGLLRDGSGPASIWYGGGDVQAQLAAEYRKAAVAAAARGDHRRAAFIYGKLLRDYRLAAAALENGGLHHDAAILYLEKLGDPLAAARAFAAAGEIDRALQLYRQRHEHALAGDLLRRTGDAEGAIAEYTFAAQALASHGDFLGAGDLLWRRAGRVDLARIQFAAGWADRSGPRASACVLRLVDIYADQDDPGDLLTLCQGADAYYAVPGYESEASQFYDLLARAADRPHRAKERDALRDRALLGLANKVRQRADLETRPGTVVSSLLGRSGQWPAAVVSDAEFAFKAAVGNERPRLRDLAESNRVRLHDGTVTAACFAREGGVLFVGFADGTLAAFTPGSPNQPTLRPMLSAYLMHGPGAVVALAADPVGDSVVAVVENNSGGRALRRYSRERNNPYALRYALGHNRALPGTGPCDLSPVMHPEDRYSVALWDGEKLQLLAGSELVPHYEHPLQASSEGVLVLSWWADGPRRGARVLVNDGISFRLILTETGGKNVFLAAWSPDISSGSALRRPPVSWLHVEHRRLELAGLGASGDVCWSEIDPRAERAVVADLRLPPGPVPFRAVTLVERGHLAAVTERGVDWLRASGKSLSVTATTRAKLPDAVACFLCGAADELLVVCSRGDIVRVPKPQ